MRKKLDQPKGGTVHDWIRYYEQKTGDRWRFDPGEQLLYDPDHGLATWAHDPNGEHLLVGKVVGDGLYWERVLNELTKTHGYSKALFFTRHPLKAFLRLFGGKLYGYYIEREVR